MRKRMETAMGDHISPAEDLLKSVGNERYGTILADPPGRFANKTGKMAPEHKRLRRYDTLSCQEINELPVRELALPKSHLSLWLPSASTLDVFHVGRSSSGSTLQ